MPANKYTLKDGTPIPGVTTVCNQLDKPQLLDWVWKLGKKGKDWREQRDSAGDIGTLVHELVIKFIQGNLGAVDFEAVQPKVLVCLTKFKNWWADETKKDISVELIEQPLVSEVYKFGGQLDIYAKVNGKRRLIDIKTSGGIYDSYWYQLAGYGILLKVNGYKVDEYQILWLPKDDSFDCPIRENLKREKQIFKHLLEIYKLRRRES